MKTVDKTKRINKEAKATKRCVYDFLMEKGVTFTVEGTSKVAMGIEDPFMDERGFSNPACATLMMEFARNKKMFEYASETCYYIKYQNRGLVVTESMFEYI